MRRFSTILLFLALTHYVTCNVIVDRETKDVPMKDAELEEYNAVEPTAVPVEGVAVPNAVTEAASCARVGEFCSNHKDCCSHACMGYLKRCVSAKKFVEI